MNDRACVCVYCQVINKLAEMGKAVGQAKKKVFIPYRNSKLTRVLQVSSLEPWYSHRVYDSVRVRAAAVCVVVSVCECD